MLKRALRCLGEVADADVGDTLTVHGPHLGVTCQKEIDAPRRRVSNFARGDSVPALLRRFV